LDFGGEVVVGPACIPQIRDFHFEAFLEFGAFVEDQFVVYYAQLIKVHLLRFLFGFLCDFLFQFFNPFLQIFLLSD
jgi:hypothetical protein